MKCHQIKIICVWRFGRVSAPKYEDTPCGDILNQYNNQWDIVKLSVLIVFMSDFFSNSYFFEFLDWK